MVRWDAALAEATPSSSRRPRQLLPPAGGRGTGGPLALRFRLGGRGDAARHARAAQRRERHLRGRAPRAFVDEGVTIFLASTVAEIKATPVVPALAAIVFGEPVRAAPGRRRALPRGPALPAGTRTARRRARGDGPRGRGRARASGPKARPAAPSSPASPPPSGSGTSGSRARTADIAGRAFKGDPTGLHEALGGARSLEEIKEQEAELMRDREARLGAYAASPSSTPPPTARVASRPRCASTSSAAPSTTASSGDRRHPRRPPGRPRAAGSALRACVGSRSRGLPARRGRRPAAPRFVRGRGRGGRPRRPGPRRPRAPPARALTRVGSDSRSYRRLGIGAIVYTRMTPADPTETHRLFHHDRVAPGYASARPYLHPEVFAQVRGMMRPAGRLRPRPRRGLRHGALIPRPPRPGRRGGRDRRRARHAAPRAAGGSVSLRGLGRRGAALPGGTFDLVVACGSIDWVDRPRFMPRAAGILERRLPRLPRLRRHRPLPEVPGLARWYDEAFLGPYPRPRRATRWSRRRRRRGTASRRRSTGTSRWPVRSPRRSTRPS